MCLLTLLLCFIPLIPLSLLVLFALSDSSKQQSKPLMYGALFAFLSQLSSIGKGFQKVGVSGLPELTFRRTVLRQYASSVPWRTGFLMDVTGALFGLGALTILPISIAQPIFCNGLVLLALFSRFHLKEQLGLHEWFAICLCFGGTVLLAMTLVPRDWSHTDIRWIQVKLGLVMTFVLPLLVMLELGSRRAKTSNVDRSVIELLAGVQAGLCIGAGNASLATGLQSLSRSWIDHLHDDQALSLHYLCTGVFIVFGALLNASHPLFANRGYQHGRVVIISTIMAIVSMATGVFMGMFVLDEAWPTRQRVSLLRSFAFLLLFIGVITLNWQNILSLASTERVPIAAYPMAPSHRRNHSDPSTDVAQLSRGERKRTSSTDSPLNRVSGASESAA